MMGFFWALLWFASPAWSMSPDEAVRQALARSPQVAAAEAETLRAEGALRAATGLPGEPQLSASTALVGEAWQVSVMQPVSLSGEGLSARRAALSDRNAAALRRHRVALEVAAEARVAWTRAVVAQQQALLRVQSLELAEQLAQGSARRFASGEGSELEATLAAFELERARATYVQALVAEAEALARLSALTGAPVQELSLPSDPLLAAPMPSDAVGGVRSDVLAAEAELEAARAALRVSQAQTAPTLWVGAFVEEEGPELRAGPRVSLTLPVWQRNADGRAAAQAELALASARLRAVQRSAAAEQSATSGLSGALEAQLEAQPADLAAQAQLARKAIASGVARGELDPSAAAALHAQVLEGQVAWLQTRALAAEARLARSLALEDPGLLP